MARKISTKRINKMMGKDYKAFSEPFEVTVARWALQAAQQLRDAYKTQKVFNGTKDRTYEVWHRRKAVKYRNVRGKRVPVPGGTVDWGWFDENAYRKKNDNGNYWYSTGQSFRKIDVTTENLKMHEEADKQFLIQGQVTFHTTLQMLYAEAGVGANGRKKGADPRSKPLVRPKDIAVLREAPWTHKRRYTPWIPGKGEAVRPNTRQQVNLLRRRLNWLARVKYTFELSNWLISGFENLMTEYVEIPAINSAIVFQPSRAAMARNSALEDYIDSNKLKRHTSLYRELTKVGGQFDIEKFRRHRNK